MMEKVLVAGSGKIGALIACLLADSNAYEVTVIDNNAENLQFDFSHPNLEKLELDITQPNNLQVLQDAHHFNTVVSSLPYFCSLTIAEFALKNELHYFDLTEDVVVAEEIKRLAANQPRVFATGCGSAPGLISIISNSLIKQFSEVSSVKMRTGCLPVFTNNALRYALTWSTDGLINEYGNMCYGLVNGHITPFPPLEEVEEVVIDGVFYEAFNTSGGIGSLANSYEGKIMEMNYKTMRYPGHRDKMHFLMNDLKLNYDRPMLKKILERALPTTQQDVMIFYAAVRGKRKGQFSEETHVLKIYAKTLFNKIYSAIQISTAASLCAVLDIATNNSKQYHGFVLQEAFDLADIQQNRFGKLIT